MRSTSVNGGVGVSSTLLGVAGSFAPVETWLRIASLAVGLAVGIVTLMNLLERRRQMRERGPRGEEEDGRPDYYE